MRTFGMNRSSAKDRGLFERKKDGIPRRLGQPLKEGGADITSLSQQLGRDEPSPTKKRGIGQKNQQRTRLEKDCRAKAENSKSHAAGGRGGGGSRPQKKKGVRNLESL